MLEQDLEKKLIAIRKDLHQNYAELAMAEHRTAAYIRSYLKQHSKASIMELGATGTMAVYKSESAKKTILIRADIDALPIRDINTFEHRSRSEDVSHKCGHDGHTTILLALMHLLEAHPIEAANVLLLWQPGEETGEGAKDIISNTKFQQFDVDEVYALHNLPGFPLDQILYKSGSFTANVKSLILNFEGKTAHAAEPEHGHNPAYALSEILAYAQTLQNNEPDAEDFFLITPVYATVGSKDYGIAAGNGSLHLTIRAWSAEFFEQKTKEFLTQVEALSTKNKLKLDVEWTQEFWSNQNDATATERIAAAAAQLGLERHQLKSPFKWGEDFGLFTQKTRGAMFGIGAGSDCAALHNPDYDFPDAIIATGAKMFYKIIENAI